MHDKCPKDITVFKCKICNKKGKCQEGRYDCVLCKYAVHEKCANDSEYKRVLVDKCRHYILTNNLKLTKKLCTKYKALIELDLSDKNDVICPKAHTCNKTRQPIDPD